MYSFESPEDKEIKIEKAVGEYYEYIHREFGYSDYNEPDDIDPKCMILINKDVFGHRFKVMANCYTATIYYIFDGCILDHDDFNGDYDFFIQAIRFEKPSYHYFECVKRARKCDVEGV